jgi:hypothetical protein
MTDEGGLMPASVRTSSTPRGPWLDGALAIALFAVTVGYLAALPLSLGGTDEGHLLHVAKRVLEGEVIYRDVFDFSTPGWTFLMAGSFGIFGTTLATARLTVALIHAGTALLMFLACRRLGVRRSLAWAAGFAYLVVCQPMLPVASYHWLATFLSVALLVLCLRATASLSWAFVLGVGVGLMIAVHQQRGFGIGLAVAAFVVAQVVIQWRHGSAPSPLSAWQPLVAFSAGVVLVVASLLVFLIAIAGAQPVWNCLVVFPLVNYRGAHTAPWGWDVTGRTRFALSRQLKYLPLIMLAGVPTLLALWWRGRSPECVRWLSLLMLFCACAIFSILYFPDSIHIALIAPIFVVTWVAALEYALRLLPARVHGVLGTAVAAVVLLSGGLALHRQLIALRAQFPIIYQSAFGPVALATDAQPQPEFWDQLRALLDAGPSRFLYSYPIAGYSFLLSGAQNPTRFALIVPGPYTPQDQVAEILRDLAAKRVPYVVAAPGVRAADDPIAAFIRQHYQPITAPQPLATFLWRRKDRPADAGGSDAS